MAEKSKSVRLIREFNALLQNAGLSPAEADEALSLLVEALSAPASADVARGVIFSKRIAHRLAKKRLGDGASSAQVDALSDHYYTLIITIFVGLVPAGLFATLERLYHEVQKITGDQSPTTAATRPQGSDTTATRPTVPQPDVAQDMESQFRQFKSQLADSSRYFIGFFKVFDTEGPSRWERIFEPNASTLNPDEFRLRRAREYKLNYCGRRVPVFFHPLSKAHYFLADADFAHRLITQNFTGIEVFHPHTAIANLAIVAIVGRAEIDDFGALREERRSGLGRCPPFALSGKALGFLLEEDVKVRWFTRMPP